MSARAIPETTRDAQRRASDPESSAWVSAHAGSGKTYVLTRRVVRLLLGGAPPSRILCLTYTKAAAANMSARIFDVLANWALLDDAALDAAVEASGGGPLDPAKRELARQLFARAVETPGGLKIQTIHAFCERILHRFPFEANVPAEFRMLDDIERKALLQQAYRETLGEAMRDGHPLHDACVAVARETKSFGFESLIEEALRLRGALGRKSAQARARDMRRRLALREGDTLASIEAAMLDAGLPASLWPGLAKRLRRGGKNDAALADRFDAAFARAPDRAALDDYLAVFFKTDGAPRGLSTQKIVSKKLSESEDGLLALLEDERDRLVPLKERRKAAATFERSCAFGDIAADVAARFERAKNRRGLLDFDDLIERTRRLLRRSSPSWVLYKLDQQIAHVLLDEAQDTSAAQWEILRTLAEEFAQEERPAPPRTLFAVGDEKQSIYSFQGAAPEKFDAMRRSFANRFANAKLPFAEVRLHLSFRSSRAILACVDQVFAHGDNRLGLSFDPATPAPVHSALKQDAPGLVEIWEPIGAEKEEPPPDWRLPMDYVAEGDPAVVLARRVARKIKGLLAPESGEWVEGSRGPRPIEAGDVLVLVRKRDAFFEAIIRALKEEHIAVAGADRLDLAGHIAVMDLCALGRAALLPQDDLTLATLLKSPLVGLDDDDLIALAPERGGALVDALQSSPQAAHRAAGARLEAWRAKARQASPFEFFAQALGLGGGRKRLVARLGAEANDAIDEFLNLALAFERDSAGGLVAFLAAVEKLDLSIKRDMEAAGEAVRVMTVHAAKGLEAKVVFLPDTCGAPSGRFDPKIFALKDGPDDDDEEASLVWSPRAEHDVPPVAAVREALRAAAREEHHRLLYVALTRAEERLYVAGYHGVRGPAEGCWHEMISAALTEGFERAPDPFDPAAHILRSPSPPAPIALEPRSVAVARAEIPSYATTPAAPEAVFLPPLRPSSPLAGADASPPTQAAAPTRQGAERLLLGRLTHALLQYLPRCAPERRRGAALDFLELRAAHLDPERRESAARAALRVVESDALAPLFGPQSAAEVDIVARIETARGPREIVGRIDRLAVTQTQVWVADFKTGKPQEEPRPEQLRQLALYRAAVAKLYPEKQARCVLVFTEDASVVEPGAGALDAALDAVE